MDETGRRAVPRHLGGLALAVLLVACGGGGGGGDPGSGGGVALTLSGTAVQGAALGNVVVQVKCASGTGQATTSGDGRFTVNVSGGSMPCVLQAPLPGGGTLHSAVTGSGDSATVNISPLTELALAGGLNIDPATLFQEFDTRRATLTSAALDAGVQQVIATLQGTIDLSGVNPLTDALAVGNPLDLKIDALNEKLAEVGSSFADLRQALVTTAPPGGPPPTPPADGDYDAGTSAAPSVAAEVLLKPAADSCPAMRSGTARYVNFTAAEDFDTGTAEIDARTLQLRFPNGGSDTLVPIGTCRFRYEQSGTELVISQAGIGVHRESRASSTTPGATVFNVGIAFPEQTHALAALAGPWNTLGQWTDGAGGTFSLRSGSLTLDASGAVTEARTCADLKTCEDDLTGMGGTLSVNATGGFDLKRGGDTIQARVFFFRAGGGAMMGLVKRADGSYLFLTRPRRNSLPALPAAHARSWNATINNQLVASAAINESGSTTQTVDPLAQSFVRQSIFGLAGATVAETQQVNQPRDGYTTRLADLAAPTSTGGTSSVREFVLLNLRGMGMTPVALPATGSAGASLILSVTQAGSNFVPAEMLNRIAARTCSALRSGIYRLVAAAPGTGTEVTQRMTVDAATLALNFDDGDTDTLVPDGPCRFTNADGFEISVSPAGVIVARDVVDNRLFLAFPEQNHPVAALESSWNKLGLQSPEVSGNPFFPDAATVTHDAQGSASQALYCVDVSTCQSLVLDPPLTHSINPTGGFDRLNGGTTDRAFLFRAGSDDLMLVVVDGNGALGLWTRQRRNGPPEVGTRSRNWLYVVGADLTVTTRLSADTVAALGRQGSVDTIVRNRTTESGARYQETLLMNAPRDGYTFRAAAAPTASDGSTVTVSEFTSLFLRGMGLSALKVGPDAGFMLSVTQP